MVPMILEIELAMSTANLFFISDWSVAIVITVSASLLVSLFFAWLRLCQDQATSTQPTTLDRTNKHSTAK